jgi:hypothetical protein
LEKIRGQFLSMNSARIGRTFRQELRSPSRALQADARARVLATPTHDRHSGLRARVAAIIFAFARTQGHVTAAGTYVEPDEMPSGEYSLP